MSVPSGVYPLSSSLICSGETESRGKGEGRVVGSVGSDEANNWGMDDSIDVNAVRYTYGTNARRIDRYGFRHEHTNRITDP